MNYQVLYWRPKRLSRSWLWGSLIVSLVGLALVQQWTSDAIATDAEILLQSAQRCDDAMQRIGSLRRQNGHCSLLKHDPQDSHLIGPSMSQVTTKMGSLEAKQTSINPNFAAVVTAWLLEAGVKPGDRIAIGASGSWPAFNMAVYAAAETLRLRPTVVLSCGSSQYGANAPDMLWVDMERVLYDAQLVSFHASAVSLGGLHDRAAGMTESSRGRLLAAVARNRVPLLATESVSDSVRQRMALYDQHSGGGPYAAYINIGGGSASIGGTEGQRHFGPGIHRSSPVSTSVLDCVATRMLAKGVPVIHVGDAEAIAGRYAFAIAPVSRPEIGVGNIYGGPQFRIWLVLAVMAVIWSVMVLTVAPRWCQRIKQVLQRLCGLSGRVTETGLPVNVEWMV